MGSSVETRMVMVDVCSTLERCPSYQKLRNPLLSGNMAEIYLCGPELDFRSAKVAREVRNKPLPNPNLDLLTRFEPVVKSRTVPEMMSFFSLKVLFHSRGK